MIRKWLLIALLAGLFLVVRPAKAGGCCLVMTLDELPDDVRAGETVEIGFMMRGNQMPLSGQQPFIVATNRESGEQLAFEGTPGETPGHYVASARFPNDGLWQWELRASREGYGQQLPPLTVLPSEAIATAGGSGLVTEPARQAMRWAALALGLLAVFMLLREGFGRRDGLARREPEWGEA